MGLIKPDKKLSLFISLLSLVALGWSACAMSGCRVNAMPSTVTPSRSLSTPAPSATLRPTWTPFPSPTSTPTQKATPTATDIAERVGEVALVTQVLDGDTIEVQIDDKRYRVRYIGIDSPEEGQPLGQEASEFNRQLVEGKKVILEKDVSETDRYDRLLRYVYLPDGTFINAALVGAGFARAVAYPPDTRFHDYLSRVEQEAREKGLGMWAQPTQATPVARAGEVATGGVFIDPACSQFNAPGNDNNNKTEEYVCLTNPGSDAVALSGWTIRDQYGWTYTFPDFILGAGASVRVRTGCGDNTPEDLYWCKAETAIWNNSGDCAYLSDATGELVNQYCY